MAQLVKVLHSLMVVTVRGEEVEPEPLAMSPLSSLTQGAVSQSVAVFVFVFFYN